MRKVQKTILATTIYSVAAQASPFVGEHLDASTINHGDGRMSMKMTPKAAAFNKYESTYVKDGLFKDRWTYVGAAMEAIFGKEESDLDYAYADSRAKGEDRGRLHKLGDGKGTLTNKDGTMWTGQIYMGGNTKMDVVFDTGSDWLVMEGKTCSNCEGNKYNPQISNGKPKKISTKSSERNYGSASLVGYEWTDKVCIDLGHCVEDFEFFLIQQQKGISEPIDGILGLSRNNPFHLNPEGGNTTGPLLIEALANANIINANMFSFYFEPANPSTNNSWIDLGQPDLSNVRQGTTLKPTQLIDPDFFWGFQLTGVAIGDISNAFAFENTEKYPKFIMDNSIYSIIDTGSTALSISALYYESLIVNLFEKAGIDDWKYEQGVIFTKCKYKLPKIFFLLDAYWIEANPKDYMWADWPGNDGGKTCLLFIMPTNSPMNILGMPVHVDYYTVHDPKTGIVQWAPHKNSDKKDLQPGVPPTKKFIKLGDGGPSPTEQLIGILVNAGCALGFIYLWMRVVYPLFVTWANKSTMLVRIYSALYFAFAFAFITYAIAPLVQMILFADQAKSASYNMKSSGSLKSMSEAMVALSGVLGFAILIKVFVAKGTKPRSENQEEKDLKTLLEQVTQQYEHENSMQ